MSAAAVGRVTAYLARLRWRGLLAGMQVDRVYRARRASVLVLRLAVLDTQASGELFDCRIEVRCGDDAPESEWTRRLLEALAEAIGHEIGEAVLLDGVAVADPHARPRVWPWRPSDREGGQA